MLVSKHVDCLSAPFAGLKITRPFYLFYLIHSHTIYPPITGLCWTAKGHSVIRHCGRKSPINIKFFGVVLTDASEVDAS